jgi:hypothetical protein
MAETARVLEFAPPEAAGVARLNRTLDPDC